MRSAADAGIAPRVRYCDPAHGITVMDFIDARPLTEHPGGREAVARELGDMLRRLQACPPFPAFAGRADPLPLLLQMLAGSGLFAPGLLDAHAEALARLRVLRPWDPAALAPSHNDPNPRNLISDGRRLWLIDWELAGQNDPLFDLAIVSLDLADTPALQARLLQAALGRAPGEADVEALAIVRLLVRLFYGCIALEALTHDSGRAQIASLVALTPAEFRAEVEAGRLGAGHPDATAYAFGLMSLRAFLDGANALASA
jgi:hypothetical protein